MDAEFYIKPVTLWECLEKIRASLRAGWHGRPINKCIVATQLGDDTFGMNEWPDKVIQYQKSDYLDALRISINLGRTCNLYFIGGDDTHSGPYLRFSAESSEEFNALPKLAEALANQFTIVPKWEARAVAVTDAQLAGFKFAETTVASLASETTKISQAVTESFEAFIKGVKERSLELEDQFQKKASDLELNYQKKREQLEAENATKFQELEAQKRAHADEVAKFEVRNNTFVRRDLLGAIRSKIEEQKEMKISDATTKKRYVVHAVCLATMGFAAILITVFAWRLFSATNYEWRLVIPLSAWTAIFVSTGIYYLKWNDQWFRDHARAEFENRKNSGDILRASWLAELFFEWKEKKEVGMPPELISSLSRNLFEPFGSDPRLHPIDQLNDTLRQFSSFEMTKGGMKFTRSDAKKE